MITSKEFYFLRRKVNIWGDLVKLRYGNSKEDSPKLWNHMTEYVQLMARYFNGFRIDNCHNTPLHVGKYFIEKARNVNHSLIVFAELFTNSK
jgi:glycogen debranching enzyme